MEWIKIVNVTVNMVAMSQDQDKSSDGTIAMKNDFWSER
jgi:hypothetical protein